MEKILKEEIIDVRGTTKLTVGDPMYLENIANGTDRGCEKKLVFDGSISGAPLGKLRIRKIHCTENELEWDIIDVSVFQAGQPFMLDTYLGEQYYNGTIVKNIDLGCDTAHLEIHTKYGSDEFHTGADGYYGHLYKYKQGFGMDLNLSFDAEMFDYEEIKQRMLKLFPERKKVN